MKKAISFVLILLSACFIHLQAQEIPVENSDISASIEKKKVVKMLYTNWRGETGWREIIPESIHFGSTEWHSEQQWLLRAFDLEKNAHRDFALKDIQKWNSAAN